MQVQDPHAHVEVNKQVLRAATFFRGAFKRGNECCFLHQPPAPRHNTHRFYLLFAGLLGRNATGAEQGCSRYLMAFDCSGAVFVGLFLLPFLSLPLVGVEASCLGGSRCGGDMKGRHP